MATIFGLSGASSVRDIQMVTKPTTARSLAQLSGVSGILDAEDGSAQSDALHVSGFEDAMLQALNGVNQDQLDASQAIESFIVDPDSIEAHDVTIAMAKANMSLNIARTVLSRVVSAWRDLINTR
ncbi:MAG TPA: flagellar hook-basal body complex protein FliE [Spirochaetales bacterium]|nr:flagellar hook-basal body complex protein FliE [Spirochaetales bacterium]MBP7262705.1 flagellar hook-basal body complex protein FliE [Spirochaetia bacterium]HPE35539.1 flagellar hook-basal body complex protein FliE [Spirochaetales bacterium]